MSTLVTSLTFFEDTKSKFLDVSDVDVEGRVDDSLVGILKLKLKFGT